MTQMAIAFPQLNHSDPLLRCVTPVGGDQPEPSNLLQIVTSTEKRKYSLETFKRSLILLGHMAVLFWIRRIPDEPAADARYTRLLDINYEVRSKSSELCASPMLRCRMIVVFNVCLTDKFPIPSIPDLNSSKSSGRARPSEIGWSERGQ